MKRIWLYISEKLSAFYLILLFFAAWQIIPSLGLVNTHFFPPLSQVLSEAGKVGYANILVNILVSLRRVAVGFLLATAVALPLGFVLAGAFRRLADLLSPLTTFLAQIPPFILFPVFVVIFGTGELSVHIVIFWSAVWPILFYTVTGATQVDSQLVKSARSMGADKLSIFFYVILPSSLPSILTGMRSGLTLCFMMLIGAETMGASSGMGWQINMAKRMAVVPRIYLITMVVAVVGLLINYLFELLENRIVIWKDVEEI
jgi:NitT/TauT family transport system permease protein